MKLYDLCLAPVVLIGIVSLSTMTTQVSPSTARSTGQGEIVQAMTCEKEWGVGVKATTSGLYALEAQYGARAELGKFTISLIPKAGFSYADHSVKELPQDIQFSVSAQLLVGYDRYRTGIELWHLSRHS